MSIEFVSERSFESNGVQLAAKEWGSPVGRPIIALHGWLDNANSFDRMLPHMDQVHVIAVDMAGHSQSGFRSADSGYDIWQDIADVMAIAEQMGWNRFWASWTFARGYCIRVSCRNIPKKSDAVSPNR